MTVAGVRVIAGSARGMQLRVPQGTRVRPTSGRVRTSLFSILGGAVVEARVLDLFAGCGSLGIEALSRGAARCCFVEKGRAALAALKANLAKARLADRAEVVRADVFAIVAELEARGPFDLVFADPPYDVLHQAPAQLVALLEELAESPALDPAATIVVQHGSRTPLPDAIGPLRVTDCRRYANTTLTWLGR